MGFIVDKKFGFGCMRLPVLNKKDNTTFDYELIEELFDRFLEKGFTYFDTAYTYHSYHCEEALRKCLVERYPREAFQLATKLPLRDFKDEADMESIFNEQLRNSGVEYFDYYLLHNMGVHVYGRCCEYNAFSFLQRKKREGKIRAAGMSFHDTPELLIEILDKYGDCLDFLQLQINYADWEQPSVQSRRCLEIANKYNKPVCVMEPCKGGTLANIPQEAERLMRDYAEDISPAAWALRFAAGQPGVFMVLSGMNSMKQVEENTEAFKNFKPLNDEELAIIEKVRKIIDSNTAISCTGCDYCTQNCPEDIAIPEYFALYNSIMANTGSFSSQTLYYNNMTMNRGKASQCIRCLQCEKVCPQHLPITEYLHEVEEKLEKASIFPVRK